MATRGLRVPVFSASDLVHESVAGAASRAGDAGGVGGHRRGVPAGGGGDAVEQPGGKLHVRDRLLGSLELRGDEKVLDVGCGRGLFLIGAVRRLTSGRGTGVDIWSAEDLSSNSADGARANAKAEGVADRIRLEDADARKLPFANESFDVVLSSLAIHNIEERDERSQAIAEMVRVLKPGGRLALFDIRHTGEYARQLQQLGLAEVKSFSFFLSVVPAGTITDCSQTVTKRMAGHGPAPQGITERMAGHGPAPPAQSKFTRITHGLLVSLSTS